MLTLPIKKKWFDMILSGKKQEEYREIKLYWEKRFKSARLLDFAGLPSYKTVKVKFKNGYSKNAPSFIADVTIKNCGKGRKEWGAERDKVYYILSIGDIEEQEHGNMA